MVNCNKTFFKETGEAKSLHVGIILTTKTKIQQGYKRVSTTSFIRVDQQDEFMPSLSSNIR